MRKEQLNPTPQFIQKLSDLAVKGAGYCSPHPMDSFILSVQDDILIEGYRKDSGYSRTLLSVLSTASINPQADHRLYLFTDYCFNEEPGLIQAIIQSKIRAVFIGTQTVESAEAVTCLRKTGITVLEKVSPIEALRFNSLYHFYKTNLRPYIVMKSGLTLDGKIASAAYQSQWITNERSRLIDHRLRLRLRSIAAGHNTVRFDHPRFNCRIPGYEDKPVDRLIFAREDLDHLFDSFSRYPGRNYQITPEISDSPQRFLDFCRKEQIDSILIEGGSFVYSWFLRNKLVDRVILIYRPSFMGNDGIPVFRENGTEEISGLTDFQINKTALIDDNIIIDLSNGEPVDLLLGEY